MPEELRIGLNAMRRNQFGSKLGKVSLYVQEGIVLVHKISKKEIEIDKAKITAIETLPQFTSVRAIRSFLGHVGFH